MINNAFALENFITFCDDMIIAEEGIIKKYFNNKINETKKWRQEHSKPSTTSFKQEEKPSKKKCESITETEYNQLIPKIKAIIGKYNLPVFKYWSYYQYEHSDKIIIAHLEFRDYVDDKFDGEIDDWIGTSDYEKYNKVMIEIKDKIESLSSSDIDVILFRVSDYDFIRIDSKKKLK